MFQAAGTTIVDNRNFPWYQALLPVAYYMCKPMKRVQPQLTFELELEVRGAGTITAKALGLTKTITQVINYSLSDYKATFYTHECKVAKGTPILF